MTQGGSYDKTVPFEERFWGRVVKFDACWEWFGRCNRKRYGVIRHGKKSVAVHRVSWEIHHGAIPVGMHVLHSCDVPWCVNPGHLWLGSNLDNIADKMAKGRHRSPTGEQNGESRLTWQQVEEIRALYWEQDVYQKDIAARFDITQPQVSKIVNEKRWLARSERTQTPGHRTLEITEVRVERVQEIDNGDALAEGMNGWGPPHTTVPFEEFARLWDSLNASRGYGWDANPWVWVVRFRRVET
ncbi:MAG: HNH endonuclease [Vicinamibacteria bacterium]